MLMPPPFVPEGAIADFDPTSSSNFHFFKATLAGDGSSKTDIIRSTTPAGYKLGNGGLEELNIGIAEAIISDGEITGFNVINEGNSFPSSDSIFR